MGLFGRFYLVEVGFGLFSGFLRGRWCRGWVVSSVGQLAKLEATNFSLLGVVYKQLVVKGLLQSSLPRVFFGFILRRFFLRLVSLLVGGVYWLVGLIFVVLELVLLELKGVLCFQRGGVGDGLNWSF